MNEKLGFFKQLIISIAGVKRYKELINQRLSKAIIYSILFSLLIGSVIGGFNYAAMGTIQKTITKVMSKDEYKFELENGVLNFENSPLKVEEGSNILYVDTDVSINDVNSIKKIVVHKDSSVAFLKDGISYRANGQELNLKYSEMNLVEKVDNKDIIKSLGLIDVIKYIGFIVSIIFAYINFIFNAFILSVLGIILNKINRLNLKYGDIFKICIYATTLPTILGLFLPLGAYSMLISGTYLVLTINNLRREIPLQ